MKIQILYLFFSSLVLSANTPMTLNAVIKTVLSNSFEIKEANLSTKASQIELDKAKGLWKPELNASIFTAPIWETTGNYSHSKNNYSKWGIFTGGELSLTQPLFAWKIEHDYITSAQHGLKVTVAEVKKKQNDLIQTIIKLFHEHILAKKLLSLADSNKNNLSKVENYLKKKKLTRDLLRLQIKTATINEKLAEAKLAVRLTEKALSYYTGIEDISIVNELPNFEIPAKDLQSYELEALSKNYDIIRLKNGLIARQKLLQAERKKAYPILAAGLKANYKYSNVKEKQESHWANDPYNGSSAGAFLLLKLKLNFNELSTQAKKALLEYNKLELKKNYATKGIKLQIAKAYEELQHNLTVKALTKKSMKLSKKLLVKESFRYDLKKDNGKELLEALLGKILSIKNYYSSTVNSNIKYAELLSLCGRDLSKVDLFN